MIRRSPDEPTGNASIARNVERLREAVADAAHRVGRRPGEIALMAVTKTRTAAEVEAAIAAGVTLIGENRVQEAEGKLPRVVGRAERHLIGHLQRNKAKAAAELFDAVDSVDSLRIADRIAQFRSPDRPIDVLIEVNTSGEISKFGATPDEAPDLVGAVATISGLRVRGLMTVGALSTDEPTVRQCFATLRTVRDRARVEFPGVSLDVLSMGMTGDFRWAVEEGSTLVRIGTGIFGPRM